MTQLKLKMSEKLKKRFCKDCNIPISLFVEPYFENRLELYDNQFNTLKKFEVFKKSLVGYKNEEDYFEDYNKFKDSVIMDIKNSEGYKKFIEDDFNKYAVDNKKLSNRDVYKEHNIGKTLMSIDMVKANFTAMKHYDGTIFQGKKTYEDYVSLFTNNQHFINSKYIRQVIFGNNNPKRQITYQKFLMNQILEKILTIIDISKIESFGHDEIVLDITNLSQTTIDKIKEITTNLSTDIGVKLTIEEFILSKVGNTKGFVKEFLTGGFSFQCLDNILLPFVLRKYNNESIDESDKVFKYNGMLAKLIETPDLS